MKTQSAHEKALDSFLSAFKIDRREVYDVSMFGDYAFVVLQDTNKSYWCKMIAGQDDIWHEPVN